ncbi:MAG: putative toxin-antitoxin system toxin component, PIN family [Sediminibacterium sp.]|nr:putative toxin-antitoxin system toxin component, PIN family [Sediminibacterium sp.]TXT31466.1 MAG: putative toxin-antitoxin system toxin component PIN family [Chitinophagaceae bacterium]
MQKAKHRIIIDTNLWISYLLTRDLSKIDELLKSNHATILFSQELLEEFLEVANRPKFKKYFSESDIKNLLANINDKAEFIKIKSIINVCRDPKDNFLLSIAKDGKATHLITGDRDLLVLKKIGKTEIITIAEYLSI